MIKSIAFTAYPVSDVARSRRFYEDILGLKVSLNFQEAWVEYDIADGTFAISNMMEGSIPGAKGAGIAFEVDDINAEVKRMKDKKIPFLLELMETPVCHMAVIADPDGNGICLHQIKSAKPA